MRDPDTWAMELQPLPSSPPRGGLAPLRLGFAGDERLARLVARGDETAFPLLYERYHQQLYRYCRSLTRQDADAQDALQSAFTSAFSALRRGQRDAPMRPWLFRIAHNECVSMLRRRRPEQELSDLTEPTTVSLEEHVEEREQLSLLVSDLHELPERHRGALVMRELSGLSHEEIALALDTSVSAAKQTIFQARRSLTEFAEGRAMACEDVCRLISDADGRSLRSRRVRAHLRRCAACSAFAAAIPERTVQLRALTPALPAVAAGAIFARTMGGGSIHGGNGAGLAAAGAGKAVGTAIATKAVAVAVAATAAVGITAALKQPKPAAHPSPANVTSTAAPARGAAGGATVIGGSAQAAASSAQGATHVSRAQRRTSLRGARGRNKTVAGAVAGSRSGGRRGKPAHAAATGARRLGKSSWEYDQHEQQLVLRSFLGRSRCPPARWSALAGNRQRPEFVKWDREWPRARCGRRSVHPPPIGERPSPRARRHLRHSLDPARAVPAPRLGSTALNPARRLERPAMTIAARRDRP